MKTKNIISIEVALLGFISILIGLIKYDLLLGVVIFIFGMFIFMIKDIFLTINN